MYRQGLGLEVIGSFENHDGFDGTMLGKKDEDFHFEFTFCREDPLQPTPTKEDLLVFYFPQAQAGEQQCCSLLEAGFKEVLPFNPYLAQNGRTFEDRDGYRLVKQRAAWKNRSAT